MSKIYITQDEAYDIMYEKEGTVVEDICREEYHMRQLVIFERDNKLYGFEYFDGLDKHMEDDLPVTEEGVVCNELTKKVVTTIEYKRVDGKPYENEY